MYPSNYRNRTWFVTFPITSDTVEHYLLSTFTTERKHRASKRFVGDSSNTIASWARSITRDAALNQSIALDDPQMFLSAMELHEPHPVSADTLGELKKFLPGIVTVMESRHVYLPQCTWLCSRGNVLFNGNSVGVGRLHVETNP